MSPAPRACDGCTLCCKLVPVTALAKPRGTWCAHCAIGRGCGIYAERPPECRDFHCGYLRDATLDAQWQPERCKMVVAIASDSSRLVVHVDPGRPDAWRRDPFFSRIKQWSVAAMKLRRLVLVCQGPNVIVVFPDREKNLGAVREDQFIYTVETRTAQGTVLDAVVIDRDDPRVAALHR
jgi:hypothetical protein